MKKSLKYLIIISLALVLTILTTIKTYADEETPVINKFKENVHNAYDRYDMYDYYNETSDKNLDLIIVEGVSENQMSLSIYYKAYNNFSETFAIKKNGKTYEYTTDMGNELYNYSYQEGDEVSVLIFSGNEKDTTAQEFVVVHYTPESLAGGDSITGLGTHQFPESTVTDDTLALKGCLAAMSVIGIFIAGILIIVIAVMLATKNIHIKRETTTYYTPRTNQYNPGTPTNAPGSQTIIDTTASEGAPTEEPQTETPITEEPLSEEDELKRLYSLHARHEITDEELDLLLRKYRGKRDDD